MVAVATVMVVMEMIVIGVASETVAMIATMKTRMATEIVVVEEVAVVMESIAMIAI